MKNKKIMIGLLSIIIVVIIAGMIMLSLKGFNKSEEYKNTSIFNVMKLYLAPVIITTIISTVYYAIIYKKNGIQKICLTTILTILLTEAFAISIYAICRIPVNILFMPVLLLIFIADFMVLSKIYSKK